MLLLIMRVAYTQNVYRMWLTDGSTLKRVLIIPTFFIHLLVQIMRNISAKKSQQ